MTDVVQMRPKSKTDTAKTDSDPASSILARVIKVAREIEPLIKNESHNEGWNFVSIDTYYEKAAKALLKEGVSWVISEETATSLDGFDVIGWRYTFSLFDEAGNAIKDFARFTVPHDLEGPQTAGKVVSYAEKVFMRQLLKLVTGEPDADTSATQKGVRRNKIKGKSGAERPAQSNPDKSDGLTYEEIEAAINAADSQAALDLYIEGVKQKIFWAKANDPDIYAKLATARAAKMKEFESGV